MNPYANRAVIDAVFKTQMAQCIDMMLSSIASGTDAGSLLEIKTSGDAIEATFLQKLRTDQGGQITDAAMAIPQAIGVALVGKPGEHRFAWVNERGEEIDRPPAAYFESHPVFSGIVPVDIDGQQMIRIPRFYSRRAKIDQGPLSGCDAWMLSQMEKPGFRLHTAFHSPTRAEGAACFYTGKYQASLQDGALASVPGVKPATNISLNDSIKAAAKRNRNGEQGWQLWDAAQLGAIRWLYLLEHGTLDCRAATGKGRTDASGVAKVDADDVVEASYRGITGLWGNVWQWLGGLKTIDGEVHLADPKNPGSWIATGHKPKPHTYYPTEFASKGQNADSEMLGDFFIAGDSTDTQADGLSPHIQYFGDARGFFPLVGGSWAVASNAGLWGVGCLYAASGADTYVGARLAKCEES